MRDAGLDVREPIAPPQAGDFQTGDEAGAGGAGAIKELVWDAAILYGFSRSAGVVQR
jgi:hypothetical protein